MYESHDLRIEFFSTFIPKDLPIKAFTVILIILGVLSLVVVARNKDANKLVTISILVIQGAFLLLNVSQSL